MLPLLQTLAVGGAVNLSGCYPTDPVEWVNNFDEMCGDWSPGRYAWRGDHPAWLREPIPCRGGQGLWTLPPELVEQVRATGAWS